MNGGELTEPYRIMEGLIEEHRNDLEEAKIEILWRAGWRSDADGFTQMVNVKKAGDVDRALSVKADYAVMLNKENFPKLSERLKTIYLHHALCHMKPMMDADGEQKQDDKGRLLWRVVKRHDIEQFSELVTLYGNDCLQLDAEAKAAIADVDRPLLAQAEAKASQAGTAAAEGDTPKADTPSGETAPADKNAWKSWPIARLNLDDSVEEFVLAAGHKTIGSLTAFMAEKGQFWVKDLVVGGQRKPPRFQEKIEAGYAEFWGSHPEFCGGDGGKW